MTVLQSLDAYYGRLAARGDADPPGYSRKAIDFCIWLEPDGTIETVTDLNDYSGKKPVPQRVAVPQEVIRTSGVSSNFLWDKTAYTLGVASDKQDKKRLRITTKEHDAFILFHKQKLAGTTDAGLLALLDFLDVWAPEMFATDARFSRDLIDKNVVFGLAGTRQYLHDRPVAQALITTPREIWKTAFCLVTGQHAPIERLHPAIQGVDGAQSSGARLVSYNADAFISYDAEGGANAPTSEVAAFRYGTALNRLLDRGSSNRVKIGDATVAFWADASSYGEAAASDAEALFSNFFTTPPSDESEAEKIRNVLVDLSRGKPLRDIVPHLEPRTIFHILGLSPNAARLSVRYWMTDEFGQFAARLAAHYEHIDIDPAPWRHKLPGIQILLVRTTAPQEKFENIPPHLAGEVTRAILEGLPYPRTLLATALMRLRAGDQPHTGWHAAVIKACLNRAAKSAKEKLPVSRDPDNHHAAYQLGRLLAVLEAAQYAALGRVNASIVDRYYAAASATPARVFGPLLRNVRNHVSDAAKRNQGHWIEPRLNEIISKLDPDLPKTLNLEDQGRFAVGYYHERAWRGPGAAATQEETHTEDAA